jgi:hypothetical protein
MLMLNSQPRAESFLTFNRVQNHLQLLSPLASPFDELFVIQIIDLITSDQTTPSDDLRLSVCQRRISFNRCDPLCFRNLPYIPAALAGMRNVTATKQTQTRCICEVHKFLQIV